jgi:hypothetical protein
VFPSAHQQQQLEQVQALPVHVELAPGVNCTARTPRLNVEPTLPL